MWVFSNLVFLVNFPNKAISVFNVIMKTSFFIYQILAYKKGRKQCTANKIVGIHKRPKKTLFSNKNVVQLIYFHLKRSVQRKEP